MHEKRRENMIPASKLFKYDEPDYQNSQSNDQERNDHDGNLEGKQPSSKGGTHYNSKGASYYNNKSYYPEEKTIFRNTPYARYDYRDDHFYKNPRQPSYITNQIHSISQEIEKLAVNNSKAHSKIMGIGKRHISHEKFELPQKRELSDYYHCKIVFYLAIAGSEKLRINELEIMAKKRIDSLAKGSEILSQSTLVDKSFSLHNQLAIEKDGMSDFNLEKPQNPQYKVLSSMGKEDEDLKVLLKNEDSLSYLMKSIDDIIHPQGFTIEKKLKEENRWQEDPDEEFNKLDQLLHTYKEKNLISKPSNLNHHIESFSENDYENENEQEREENLEKEDVILRNQSSIQEIHTENEKKEGNEDIKEEEKGNLEFQEKALIEQEILIQE